MALDIVAAKAACIAAGFEEPISNAALKLAGWTPTDALAGVTPTPPTSPADMQAAAGRALAEAKANNVPAQVMSAIVGLASKALGAVAS